MRRGLCIIGALALLCIAASPKQGSGKPEAATSNNVTAALENVALALQGDNEAPGYQQPCEEGGTNRNSDLCAQWNAADAATSSAEANWFFGYIGTLLGILTFGAAGAAAWYARKAAIHTEEAAVAAKETLGHAKDVTKIQLRPYLDTDTPALNRNQSKDTDHDIALVYSVRLANYGQTRALNVQYRLDTILVEDEPPIESAMSLDWLGVPGISPRDHLVIGDACTLSPEDFAAVMSNDDDMTLWLMFEFTYEDVFGKRYHAWMPMFADAEYEWNAGDGGFEKELEEPKA